MKFAGYQEAGLLEIPLMYDVPHVCEKRKGYHKCRVCRDIKRPSVKWKNYPGMNDEQWWNFRAKFVRKYGRAPGRGSLTGPRTGLDGYHILAVDHDHPRPPITENIGFYRARETWVNFTPNGGWHEIYLVPRRYSVWELEKAGLICSSNLESHDIIWWVPPGTTGRRIRRGGDAAYFAHEPTTINGRPYFWLDQGKINHGELKIRRLDL